MGPRPKSSSVSCQEIARDLRAIGTVALNEQERERERTIFIGQHKGRGRFVLLQGSSNALVALTRVVLMPLQGSKSVRVIHLPSTKPTVDSTPNSPLKRIQNVGLLDSPATPKWNKDEKRVVGTVESPAFNTRSKNVSSPAFNTRSKSPNKKQKIAIKKKVSDYVEPTHVQSLHCGCFSNFTKQTFQCLFFPSPNCCRNITLNVNRILLSLKPMPTQRFQERWKRLRR